MLLFVLCGLQRTGFSQEKESNKKSELPYRRVFLPLEDLNQLDGLDLQYTTRSLDELSELLKPFQSSDPQAANPQRPPELLDAIYSARLVGPDLVSTRSMIRVSRGSMLSERLRLAPWGFALTPGSDRAVSPASSDPRVAPSNRRLEPQWGFDEAGTPLLKLHSDSLAAASKPIDFPFSWTLRGETLPTSSLRYETAIPRCTNSCLLLTLPPNTQVVRANVPARLILNANEIDARLSRVPAEVRPGFERTSLDTASNSLWLIELGGVENVSFEVVTPGFGNEIGKNGGAKGSSFEHLVLEQLNEYRFSDQFLDCRATMELQWDVPTLDKMLRFKLESPGKVRRVSAAGKELDWSQDGEWIQVTGSALSNLTPPRAGRLQVIVEWSYRAEPWLYVPHPTNDSVRSSDTIRNALPLPALALDKAFVFRGESQVVLGNHHKLASISAPGSQFLESTAPNMLRFQWWDQPCTIQMVMTSNPRAPTLRVLNKIMGSEGSVAFWGRVVPTNEPAKRLFAQDLVLELETGWGILDVLESETKRTIPWEVVSKPDSPRVSIRLTQENLAGVSGAVDIQLDPQESLAGETRSFRALSESTRGWIRVAGSSVEHWLVAENIPNYLTLSNLQHLSSVPLDSLSSVERSFITSSEKSAIWRWNDNRLVIQERRSERPTKVRIRTKVDQIDNHRLQVKHRLDWEPVSRKQKVPIRIPKQQQPWIVGRVTTPSLGNKISEEWLDVLPVDATNESFSIRLGPELPSLVVLIENQIPMAEVNTAIPLPQFDSAVQVQHTVELSDGLVTVEGMGDRDAWQLDAQGQLQGERLDYRIPLTVRRSTNSGSYATPAAKLVTHYLTDSDGMRRLVAHLSLPPVGFTDYEVAIGPEWKIDFASIRWLTDANDLWVQPDQTKGTIRIRSGQIQTDVTTPPHATRLYTEVLEFTADSIDRSPFPLTWFQRWDGTSLAAPEILLNGSSLPSLAHFWMPLHSSLAIRSDDADEDALFWEPDSGFRWWKESIAFLSGKDSKAASSKNLSPALPSLDSDVALRFSDWTHVDSVRSMDSPATIVVVDGRLHRAVRGFAMLLFILLPVVLRGKAAWVQALVLCIAAGAAIGFAAMQWQGVKLIETIVSGLFIGLVTSAILASLQKKRTKPIHASRTPNSNWEGSNASREIEAVSAMRVLLACCLSVPLSSSGLGQSIDVSAPGANADILFPLDSNGEVLRDSIYVPNQLLSALKGTPATDYLIYSSRFQWKVNFRNRPTAIPDQITMVYDLWIGKAGVPIQFPVATSQASLIRITVDDQDVLRYQHKPEGIEWVPERAGRRIVQLTLSPKWVTQDPPASLSGRGDEATTQAFELGLLPCPNAFVEVESLDPAIQIDVESVGGITNPSPGRYLVALGNKTSLRGSTRFQIANNLTVPSPSNALTPPSLNIELFLQNSNIRAKTVLRIPEGSNWERTFEMEADDPWQPIGNRWGGVTLVDTKPASTFSRRRYVFEVDRELLSQSQFDIPILWGLRDKSLLALNVLFAECVDRRVRPSTLRYARFPGSEWNLEQVSTWIPAINERERLDWPELQNSSNPRASSLRFPASGGFGALKRVSAVPTMQARVSTRWTLLPESQSINVRIDTLGTTNSDSLELVLPRGFIVTDASHRNRLGNLHVVQNLENSQGPQSPNRVQLFAERQLTENYEIELRAEKRNSESEVEVPWVTSPVLTIAEQSQSIDIAASELCSIQITSQDGSVRSYIGKGASNPIAMLAQSDRIQWKIRRPLQVSDVRWEIEPSGAGDRIDVIVRGRNNVSQETRSKLTIELPTGAYESVRCDRPIAQIPSPISDFSWWQIDMNTAEATEQSVDWSLQLTLSEKQLEALVASSDRFRVIDQPSIAFPTAMVKDWLAQHQLSKADLQRSTSGTNEERNRPIEFVSVWQSPSQTGGPSLTRVDYWISGTENSRTYVLLPGVKVFDVRVNGELASWEQQDDTITLQIPRLPLGIPAYIAFRVATDGSDRESIPVAPKHREAPELISGDDRLPRTLELLQGSLEWIPSTIEEGSFAHRWLLDVIRAAIEPYGVFETDRSPSIYDASSLDALEEFLVVLNNRWPQLRWTLLEIIPAIPNDGRSETDRSSLGNESIAMAYWIGSALLIVSIFLLGWIWRSAPDKLLGWLAGITWIATGLWLLAGALLLASLVTLLDNILIRRSSPIPKRASKGRITHL
ncbi:hypothetical protein [Pirellula sp. SH-Sr6A]|uniref:hypothetical protein n=1 Tax=Pirellula sp. SH-Sr6A TaxID=1632865 RepID=UPI0011BA7810|nr:hypothetical protein [Pirellula sp. SH-Sr6A]